MNPQQEAVALWRFFEERGHRPKVATIIRTLRLTYRLKFRDSDVYGWLEKFRQSPAGTGMKKVSQGHDSEESGHGFTRPVKVSLFSIDSQPSVSSTPPPRRPPRLDTRSPAAIVADKALSTLRPEIEPTLTAQTWTRWLKKNRQATVDMALAGMNAEAIVDAVRRWREAKGKGVVMSWVAGWLDEGSKTSARGNPKGDCECDLPLAECLHYHHDPNDIYENWYDLKAAGAVQ